MAERRGLQKKCIIEIVNDRKDYLTSFKSVLGPLLKQGETNVFKPLKPSGLFCDGFALPSHPFKSLTEAQSILANHRLDVILPIKSSKDGQLWTKPAKGNMKIKYVLKKLKPAMKHLRTMVKE